MSSDFENCRPLLALCSGSLASGVVACEGSHECGGKARRRGRYSELDSHRRCVSILGCFNLCNQKHGYSMLLMVLHTLGYDSFTVYVYVFADDFWVHWVVVDVFLDAGDIMMSKPEAGEEWRHRHQKHQWFLGMLSLNRFGNVAVFLAIKATNVYHASGTTKASK